MKAIILVGCSGSGKSTWAREQHGYSVISRDDVRSHILQHEGFDVERNNIWSKWSFKREKEVTELYWHHVERMAALGKNIILADTNLNPGRRQEMQKRLENLGYEVSEKFFHISYEDAVKRDKFRLHTVGHDIIWKQYKELYGETYVPPKDAPKAIIVDVDGTLAIKSNRSPFEWHRVGEDSVNEFVADIVCDYYDRGTRVIIVSGRDSVCRETTENWFEVNAIPYHEFYMRAKDDMRKDNIVKREIYDKHIRNRLNVVCALDDRPSIIRLWLLLGIKVLSVSDPYTEF